MFKPDIHRRKEKLERTVKRLDGILKENGKILLLYYNYICACGLSVGTKTKG